MPVMFLLLLLHVVYKFNSMENTLLFKTQRMFIVRPLFVAY